MSKKSTKKPMKKAVSILQIAPIVGLTGNVTMFGLGDDQRVYAWNSETGLWVPNWKQAPAITPQRTAGQSPFQ
jgi:hypothetical protein